MGRRCSWRQPSACRVTLPSKRLLGSLSISARPVRRPRGCAQPAPTRSHEVTQYLISFNDGAMSHIPEEDFPAVAKAAVTVVLDAMDAGVFIFGGGLLDPTLTTVVATDGTITSGPDPACRDFIGGFTIVDVPGREDAHHWAARIAVACRCAQDVREFMPLPPEMAARAWEAARVRRPACGSSGLHANA
eukprot:gene50382-61637_t